MLISLLSFIVVITLLVGVHECGHFWMARRCGVHVERFSIGLGKPIFVWQDRKGTEFAIAPIPLGGYVKMTDERSGTVPAEKRQFAFNNKSIGKRALIILAGPIANLLLAVVVYTAVFLLGVPTYSVVVSEIKPDSPLSQSKIVPGSELKSIAGIKITSLSDVYYALMNNDKNAVIIEYKQPNLSETLNEEINLADWTMDLNEKNPIESLGIVLTGAQVEPVLNSVIEASPAMKAGLKSGDKIIGFNEQLLTDWFQLSSVIKNSPGQLVKLEVERQQQRLNLSLQIGEKKNSDGIIEGFAGIIPRTNVMIQQYEIVSAINQGIEETLKMIRMTAMSFGYLIIGKLDLTHLSGPLSIAKVAGQSAVHGIATFLQFLGFISVTLGVVNLFPLPILDGGHLLFLLIEKIKGSPLSNVVQDFFYRIGLVLLLILMGLALFNDIYRF